MKDQFTGLLSEIAGFYKRWPEGNSVYAGGYEFLYNPESACRKETKILLMTINPRAGTEQVTVLTPCPEEHAFWTSEYNMDEQIHNLFKELKKLVDPHGQGNEKDFASQHVIASSAVPFRTHNTKQITPDMWRFSRYLWGRVFQVWEPRLVLALGLDAYEFLEIFWSFKYSALPETPQEPEKRVRNRWIQFAKPDGQRITLAGFPHFSRFHAFPKNYTQHSPACSFLREVCASSLMQQAE